MIATSQTGSEKKITWLKIIANPLQIQPTLIHGDMVMASQIIQATHLQVGVLAWL